MPGKPLVLAILLSLAIALPTISVASPSGQGNGVLLMVHGWFEPHVNDYAPVPPLPEIIATTQDGGDLLIHAVPYSVETGRPIVLDAPRLKFVPYNEPSRVLHHEPALSSNRVCQEETQYPGFEGPLAACLVYRVPAAQVPSLPVVALWIEFKVNGARDLEYYDVAHHMLLHQSHRNLADRDEVDRLVPTRTPFLLEALVDPQT